MKLLVHSHNYLREGAQIILFSTGTSSLMEMEVEGGVPPRELLPLDPAKDVDVHEPSVLPGGKGLNAARVARAWRASPSIRWRSTPR